MHGGAKRYRSAIRREHRCLSHGPSRSQQGLIGGCSLDCNPECGRPQQKLTEAVFDDARHEHPTMPASLSLIQLCGS